MKQSSIGHDYYDYDDFNYYIVQIRSKQQLQCHIGYCEHYVGIQFMTLEMF